MSNIKVRPRAEKNSTTEESEGERLLQAFGGDDEDNEDDENEPYQYKLLLKNFMYALIICILFSYSFFTHLLKMHGSKDKSMEATSLKFPSSGSGIRVSVENVVHSAINKINFNPTNNASMALSVCAQQYNAQPLTGRCFGLATHTQFTKLRKVRVVKTAAACRDLCCQLGIECQTWQFWLDATVCKLGGAASIGREGEQPSSSSSSFLTDKQKQAPWCDALPPVTWRGSRVSSRNETSVGWTEEVLQTQCYGLQSQNQLGAASTDASGSQMEEKCQYACAADITCVVWQYHQDRGCFHGSNSQTLLCEPYSGKFDGRMKRRPST